MVPFDEDVPLIAVGCVGHNIEPRHPPVAPEHSFAAMWTTAGQQGYVDNGPSVSWIPTLPALRGTEG
ncbi:hypothetical protein StoSoilB20_10000 [Arthrobacter sp. StoSoilB20]|nr:hypothetical protein StoSoilB20_10000 [Arthrobacter sp. StoSoilB20]